MALRRGVAKQARTRVAAMELPRSPNHGFHELRNRLVAEGDSDRQVEALCRPHRHDAPGRPSIPWGSRRASVRGRAVRQRALITGVCGFIGSHLSELLLRHRWTVAGIDYQADAHNIAGVRDRIGLVKAALSSNVLADLPDAESYDVIFHLAARVGPAAVIEDPLTLLREHAEHTAAVCELGARARAVVVLASSSEVYQWNRSAKLWEDDALSIGPSHLPRCGYAISKLYMEHLGLAYWRQRGVRVIVTRLFNTVGPRQRDGFVLPIFAQQALRGEPLTVHGDGSQTRTFTHVRDAVEALFRLVATPAAVGQVINVGAGEPCLSVTRVAEEMAQHVAATYDVPNPSPITYVPYAATGDLAWQRMSTRRPDVGKLQQLTGLRFPNRWDAIVYEVCADWAARLGVRERAAARRARP